MKTFPAPALLAAAAGLVAAPFNFAAAGVLLLTAMLGLLVHADYVLRYRRISLPRLPRANAGPVDACRAFRCEDHRLAA
jgi:hypothetical protein